MTAVTAVQAIVLVLVAGGGLAVVLERNPLHQAFVAGCYGIALSILFLLFHAPDVALSEVVVGSLAIPLLVLVTLSKARSK